MKEYVGFKLMDHDPPPWTGRLYGFEGTGADTHYKRHVIDIAGKRKYHKIIIVIGK